MSEEVEYIRENERKYDELREITVKSNFLKYADGSVLIEYGNTKVVCSASIEEKVPQFLKGSAKGWITAEYGMLPRSTKSRMSREAARGKQTGRTIEIQRLIGRSFRAVVDLKLLGERTIFIDCDVIQADGGTRTAAITGGFMALRDAINNLLSKGLIEKDPIIEYVAAVSVGKIGSTMLLDLNYIEDSGADVDMNLVVTENGNFVEIQGTGEESVFSCNELLEMINLGQKGIKELIEIQKQVHV